MTHGKPRVNNGSFSWLPVPLYRLLAALCGVIIELGSFLLWVLSKVTLVEIIIFLNLAGVTAAYGIVLFSMRSIYAVLTAAFFGVLICAVHRHFKEQTQDRRPLLYCWGAALLVLILCGGNIAADVGVNISFSNMRRHYLRYEEVARNAAMKETDFVVLRSCCSSPRDSLPIIEICGTADALAQGRIVDAVRQKRAEDGSKVPLLVRFVTKDQFGRNLSAGSAGAILAQYLLE